MEQNIDDEILQSDFNIKSVYSQICIEEDFMFDKLNENQWLIESIESVFNEKLRLIDSSILMKDSNLLNLSLVELIKYCYSKNYKKLCSIFIAYCDYFNLEYNSVYLLLSDKLKDNIKIQVKKIVGDKKYQKIDLLANPNQFNTLFDLIK